MIKSTGVLIYFSGLVFAEILRVSQRLSRIRRRQSGVHVRTPARISELFVVASIILGIWVFPITYTFTNWLQAFNYHLPPWMIWIAFPIFLIGLAVRWAAQRTLARQWSFTLETVDGQLLVKNGIYSYTRHPIYVSLILWVMAQPVLLPNWIAGLGGAVAVALIWMIRVPREERMMLETFSDEYSQYMVDTGRLFRRTRTEDQVA